MDISEKHYPYPVLTQSGDDYVDSAFDVDVMVSRSAESVTLSFLPSLNNQDLRDRILHGEAKIVCHVEAPLTVFRNIYELALPDNEGANPEERVVSSSIISGRVSFCPFIVASKDLKGYINSKFNSDYAGHSFDIEIGSVLAEGTQKVVFVETAKEDLAFTPSVFVVTECLDPEQKVMRVETDQKKIRVSLPTKDMQVFVALKNSGTFSARLSAMIYTSALVEVLERIRRDSNYRDESIDHRWFHSIDTAMKSTLGYGLLSENFIETNVSTLEIVQGILRGPISGSLAEIMNGGTVVDNGGDE